MDITFTNPTLPELSDDEEKRKAALDAERQQQHEQIVGNAQEQIRQRAANQDRYGITIPDEYYDVLNKAIANSPDPEEESHKFATALKYSEMYGIDFNEAYNNIDAYNAALWPDTQQPYKEWWKAVSDAYVMGKNGIRIGQIGQQMMTAEKQSDDEKIEILRQEYEAIKNENSMLTDSIPRKWETEALMAGAQSLPYTAWTAAAGMFGNFIPIQGAGIVSSWITSNLLTAGQEYMELTDKGIRPEIARPIAQISGATQAAVEAVLGEAVSWIGPAARLTGSKVISKKLQGEFAEKITNVVQKRIHFGPAGKIITKEIIRYLLDLPEEGLEEALQSLTSTGLTNIAAKGENKERRNEAAEAAAADIAAGRITDAVFDEVYKTMLDQEQFKQLPIMTGNEKWQEAKSEFKGGVLGALVLGLPALGGNIVADATDYARVKRMAEVYESPEALKKDLKETTIQTKNGETSLYDAVLDGYEDWEKDGLIHDAFDYVQNEQKAQQERQAKQLTEIQDAQENYEVFNTDEETGITERPDVFYTKEGSLYTQDKLVSEEDGIQTKQFVAGDGSKADNNMYGHIDYTVDERNKKIEIQAFKMNSERESVRYDMYEQFARQHPGYEIDYITTGKAGEDVKNRLIKMNPSGEKNGLRYYSGQKDLKSIQERKKFAEVINKNLPNIKASGQTAAVVALFESLAKDKLFNTTLENLINENFGGMENVFGSQEEFVQRVTADNEKKPAAERVDPTKKVGGFAWRKLEGEMKAVIYAGKESDFSTIVHELSHFYQDMLAGDPELQMQAETAFNVQNGDWMHSYIEGKDGKTYSSAEAFAYGAQDYFRNGALEDKGLEGLFKKFAEFVVRCINAFREHINLNKKITDVYDQMLKNDESILYAASIAAKEADRQDADYRIQQEAENAQRQQQEEKKQQETAADEKEEMAEIWDQVNAENPITEEEIDMLLDEGPEDDFDKRYKEAYDNEPYNREAVAAVELEKAFPEIFNKDLSNAELNNNFVVHMSSEIYDITAHSGFTAITSDKLPDTYHVSYAGVVDDLKQYIKVYDIPMGLTPQNEYRDEYYKYRDGFYAYSFKREKVRQLQQIEANNKDLNDAILDAADDSDDPIIELFANKEDGSGLCTPEVIAQANKYLDDEKMFSKEESSRIKKNLSAFGNTGWAKLVYLAITGRHDMMALMNNDEIPANSLFNEVDKDGKPLCDTYKELCMAGPEAIYQYFIAKNNFIGEPAKPEFAVAGSFINCNPSLECATWCYAVGGRSGMAMMILNRELVTWAIENDPVRSADIISWQWAKNTWFKATKGAMPLRLLDTGDMSENWLQLIDRLNSNEGMIYGPNYTVAPEGKKLTKKQAAKNRVNIMKKPAIMCSIFSKRGELLSKVDPVKNIIQLSVDKSNLDLAYKYPELPLSVVFDGSKEMIAFIESQQDRFEQKKGVILPVVIGQEYLTEEQIRTLPAWALKFVCPVNAGWRFIGEFSCADCYLNGQGCNQGRNQSMMKRILMAEEAKKHKGVIKDGLAERKDMAAEALRRAGFTDGQIFTVYTTMESAGISLVASDDTAGKTGSLRGSGTAAQSQDGLGSGTSKHDRLDRFQVIGELGATELDRLEEVTIRMDLKNLAEEMEAAGKDKKAIWMATGWERGLDNKWRYEISDIQLKENPKLTTVKGPRGEYYLNFLEDLIEENSPIFKAYPELRYYNVSTTIWDDDAFGSFNVTDKNIKLNSSFRNRNTKTFDDAYNKLQADPEYIAWMKKFEDNYDPNESIGDISKTANDLVTQYWESDIGKREKEILSMDRYEEGLDPRARSTLIHEIQHAIQAIEGFARGSAPEYFNSINLDELKKEEERIKQRLQSYKRDLQFYIAAEEDPTIIQNQKDYIDKVSAELDQLQDRIAEVEENWLDGLVDLEEYGFPGQAVDPYEAYARVAGEVEARNTQTRMDLTQEERWERLLEDTEDISRDDQILLFQAAEMSREEAIEELNNRYMEAVKKNDMETASRLFEQYADRKIGNFLRLQDYADEVGWKWHRGPAPINIITMYAVFNVSEDSMRAAYAGNKNPTPVGLWIDAQNLQGYTSDLKTFNDGSLPHNKLIFEVEVGMSDDGDLTEYVKENGRFDTKGNEGLAEISPLQFYFYKTNPNANGQWGIAGTFRIKRLVPYDEIVDQTAAANARIAMENAAIEQRNVGKKKKKQEKHIPHFDVQKWQGGYHPEDCGLTVGKVDMMYEEAVKAKLMDPVTYDDNGNVIPLQDRLDSRIADIRFQDDETYELRKQYENTDQWMKAPNGKPTNLNEKQWLQVRTTAFRWFGDWQNDPDNASKVIDENGEPKVVYHGTRSKERFYVFNTQDLEYRDNIGSHFGPLETAQEFSDTNLYAVYLNIKKPFMPNFDFFADQLNNAYLSVLLQMNNEAETEEAKKAFKEIYEIYPNLSDYNLENMDDDEILDNFDNDEELEDKSLSKEEYRKAHQAHRDAMVEIMIKMMEADGYDGMEYENWYEGEDNNKCYVALYPSQIKSATDNNGKFDPANPDIRFQTTETVNIPIFHFDKDNLIGQELWDAVEKHVELQEQTKQAYRDLFNDPAFMAMHTVDGEAQRYIHRNVNNPEDGYKWQISYFDRYGPWGHFHFDDLDEVFRRGDMQLEPQLVEVTYDDRIRYDRPYYDALDEKDWNKAAAIIQEYAKTKGYEGLIDTEVTDATDILIPPTKRMNRRWYTQADYDAIGRDHSLLFQTEEELYEDARKFDTWENFMDSYTLDFDPDNFDDPEYHSQVPYGADPDWYRNVWNMANNKDPQTGIRQQDLDEFTGDMSPEAMDNEFVTRLKSDPSMLDEFLAGVAYYVSQDLNSEQWNTFDNAEDQQLVQLISDMKDQIDIYLSDQNWRIAINTVRGGNQISGLKRKQLITEMSDKDKVRDFREIYAKVMENGRYEVDDKDSNRTKLRDRYELNPDRYYDIIAPYETIETMSPERRKQIAREMTTRDIADKLRSGDLALNDDVSTYIKALDTQIKDLKKKQKQAELDVQTTYTVMGNAERKYLLDLNKRLLEAKAAMTRSDRELQRKLDKGLAITEKYARENKHMKGSFDEVFRKMEDYKRGIEITKEIELAMKKQEVSQELKTEINDKQKERNLLQEIKKMRINLVKRVMRRVPFDRIDYENAKTVIAIQRLLEPNLIGGVNRWIGTSSPILRQVISNIITDTQYKEDLLHYLRMNSKASAAYAKFLNRIESLQSLDDYKTWSKSDRQAAIRYLPKENWIQDLNLKKLAREREESIDLDITTVKKERDAINTDGTVKRDWQGFPEKETYFALQYSDEIRDMVISAIGEEMFTKIVSVPFADWTTTELEDLAVRINEIYTEGRDMLKAKKELQKSKAAAIRNSIERSILDTGITINDDDPLEVREEKARRINEILGLDDTSMTGTLAAKDKGFAAKLNAILHTYNDANVRRVARILDGWHDGVNVMELCYKENDAYVAKTKKINSRVEKLNFMFEENSISLEDLAQEIKVKDRYVDLFGKETPYEMTFTVDELLYIKAAAEDFQVKEDGEEDFYAATSKNAVMYGNMMSSKADIAAKDDLKTSGKLEEYVDLCRQRMETVLKEADRLLLNHPEYRTLMKVIQDDYAMQYDRMNEISIEEFNAPVHRVKAYVPLVRLDSLQPGNSNENQVKEDLLTVNGLGKVGVNKGMTQRRIRMDPFNQAPVEMGLYKTWLNSIERTEHFIAYAPYVRELNRVYKSNDASTTRKYISARYGNNMIRYIDTYINEVANPRANQVRSAGAEILHTLRGKTAPAYLAWKASAIIKQGLTSPWPYMQFISPLEYMAASAKIIASKGELYDAIRAKSVFMKNRVMDPMNDIIDEMAEGGKTKFDRVIGKQAKIGMAGLEWIDWICVAPGWYGCYLKEYTRLNSSIEQQVQAKLDQLREDQMEVDISSGKIKTEDELKKIAERSVRMNIEDQAVKYADDCTRLCQPSSRSVDISPLFKNAGEFAQAYLQFQTSLNVIWQNIRYDIKFNAKNNLAFRTAGTIVGYVCAGIFMNSVMDGYDDDEDKELIKLRQAIFYALTQYTDAVPMVGSELTNMLDKLITGKQQFMSTGTDMTPTLTKIVAALTSVTGGDFSKAAGKFAEAVGMYLGLPVSGTKEILKEAGIGDGDGEIGLNLSSVYGILPDKKD